METSSRIAPPQSFADQSGKPLSLNITGITQLDSTSGSQPVLATSLEVGGEELRLRHRKAFHWNTHVQGIIQLADIANVRVVAGGVAFDQLRDGLIFRTITVTLSAKSRDKLIKALPSTIADSYDPEYAKVINEIAEYTAALQENIRHPWMTYLIIAACIACFVWMCSKGADFITPSAEDVFLCGGNFSPATFLYGQWWRLLSSGFIHCGLWHLFLNMWFLGVMGRQAERLFGHLLFALIYLAALLGGSLLSGALNSNIVSAGASGALFGLVGAILAYMLRNRGSVPASIRNQSINSMLSCILVNLLYGLRAGIDNWCHVGGLVAGFLCGLIAAFPVHETDRDSSILNRALILAVLIPAIGYPAYWIIQRQTPPPPAIEESE